MKCPNNKGEYSSRWICLCDCGRSKSAKHTLENLFNGWLQPDEVRRARAMGVDPNVTEEQASKHLAMLEEECSGRYGMWEQTQ